MAGSKGGRGGQGASSGGGGGGLNVLLRLSSNQGMRQYSQQPGSSLTLTQEQTKGDYTDGNNPELLKWQGQEENKSARFLSKIDKQTDLNTIQNNTGDQWGFYDNPFQKMTLAFNLNKHATELSEPDFNKYVAQSGATVLYRGWSGQNAADRFSQSPNSHPGNGINGDGYYFAPDKATARNYGGYGMKAALAPGARVISAQAVRAEIAKQGGTFQRALQYAGSTGTRTYGSNQGEAQMALKMGYNVIDAGWAVIPLTRDALVISRRRQW